MAELFAPDAEISFLMASLSRLESGRQRKREILRALDYVAQGKVKSIIETYPLSEAPKAYERGGPSAVPRRPHDVVVGAERCGPSAELPS